MNRLAHAVRAASNDAYLKASLETLADDLSQSNVSMEQHYEDLQTMVNLTHGLETIVVSAESMGYMQRATHERFRSQALDYLTLSGLSHNEAANVFPSFESEGSDAEPSKVSGAWEKFKEFIARMWKYIIEAAKKAYEFVRQFLKKSSMAEKAAMAKLRSLRAAIGPIRSGLTIDAKIPLRPAHRYLLSPSGELGNLSGLRSNVEDFIKARDMVQTKLPELLKQTTAHMIQALDALALGGKPEEVSASIVKNTPAILKAVSPMFPHALAQALGAKDLMIPLIHDRALKVKQPIADRDDLITAEQAKAYVTQFGIEVTQVDTPANLEKLGTFPALSIAEIETLLKLVEKLIDTGHSADQERQWTSTNRQIGFVGADLDDVIAKILKMKDLSPQARTGMLLAANARHAMSKWAAAPFTQLNTVNIRVVDSLLALAADQIKNYEIKDSKEEKVEKDKAEREKEERRKEADAKPARSAKGGKK